MFEVLEHLVAPRDVLRSLRQRMVRGGVLVLEVPDCTGVLGIQSATEYSCIHPLEHLNGFTPRSLARFAELECFELVRPAPAWVTCDPLRAMKTTAKRLLQPWLRPRTQAYFRLL
jgi:hypothetical protein